MALKDLIIDRVRCIAHAELALAPGLNLIHGPNGSGKTSLLEAAFMLGRGRSFRTHRSERLIRHGESSLTVVGRVERAEVVHTVGVQVSTAEGISARIAGGPARNLAELSQMFPVQVIDPGVHSLLEEGGERRRRWLDWAVFHVEPGYMTSWLRYSRALKQRNAALKAQPEEARIWEGELGILGEAVAASRARLMERLVPYWRATVKDLAGLELELHYHRGWGTELSLHAALEGARARDLARQLTSVGPHRADVLVRLDGRLARDILSRGQQKLAAVALTLAQLRLLKDAVSLEATLLLDDPAAELDAPALERFVAQLQGLRTQLVLTSLRADLPQFGAPECVFHVEQGEVRPV